MTLKQSFQTLKKHQFLLEELVRRDFVKKYKRSVLGMGWSLLSPLLSLLVMKLVFTQFFGRDMPHYTIYIFCGNVVWNYFSEATHGGMQALIGNADIFTKVNIPKYLFVFSKNAQALLSFLLTLVILFIFVAFDSIRFSWKFFLLLYPIVMLVLLNIGAGMILSAGFVIFRDVEYLFDVFMRLLMYASAIFYTVDGYSPKVQRIFLCNPVYVIIKYFRCILIDGSVPSLMFHLLIFGYTSVVLLIGAIIYKKFNTRFLYYV